MMMQTHIVYDNDGVCTHGVVVVVDVVVVDDDDAFSVLSRIQKQSVSRSRP